MKISVGKELVPHDDTGKGTKNDAFNKQRATLPQLYCQKG
jgi:hypothetical protein